MRLLVLAVATAAVALASPVDPALATFVGGQPTTPSVSPPSGSPASTFTLAFIAREQLGVNGVVASDYRIQVDPPTGASPGCAAATIAPLTQGMPDQPITLMLAPGGSAGWCPGRYTVAVLFDRGPYCPPSPSSGPKPPCPEFPSQQVDTGDSDFVVGSPASTPPSHACSQARILLERAGRRLAALRRLELRARGRGAKRSAKRAVLRAKTARRTAQRTAKARCA